MNPNWFKVRVLYNGIYPKSINELAKKLDLPPEEIAEGKRKKGEQIETDVIAYSYIRRDDIQKIAAMMQIPDSPEETLIEFIDGSSAVVFEFHETLVKRVDKFLQLEPTIKLYPRPMFIHHDMSEVEESEDEPDEDD